MNVLELLQNLNHSRMDLVSPAGVEPRGNFRCLLVDSHL